MKLKYSLALSAATLGLATAAYAQTADMPPSADPGECFARVLIPETTEIAAEQVIDTPERTEIKVIPASYETVTEQVLVKEEAIQQNYIPATYRTVTEQVLVKEASIEYRTIPARYETVTEQVMVEPERTVTTVIPAVIETYTEQIMIRPAYTTWKPGSGLFGRGAAGTNTLSSSAPGGQVATGELICRVEVPAEYEAVTRTRVTQPERTETTVVPAKFETVTKRVIAEAARNEPVEIPAIYETVTREVIDVPARVEEVVIPATFDTVTVQRMVAPATEEIVVIPATYKTVEKRVVTGGGGLEWREVLCDTNASPAKIAEVQSALTAKGYDAPTDGAFGPQTLRAMEAFQRDNGLPIGYLTVSTVVALGVEPY